jgi:Uma2 family endonuclease
MSAARKRQLVSVEDYLAGELDSPVKHEYVGGVVYAMAGVKIPHDVIAVNITSNLHQRLKPRRPCRPFSSDTKIRIRLLTHWRFYYPDASVICRSNPSDDSFQDEPVAIFEVLSKGTRRIDEGEKKDAYLTIGSLCTYLLVEQELPLVVVHRRTEHGFIREEFEGLEAVIPFPELETELPLVEMYEGVEFAPEIDNPNE